jgi:hypothetical protein
LLYDFGGREDGARDELGEGRGGGVHERRREDARCGAAGGGAVERVEQGFGALVGCEEGAGCTEGEERVLDGAFEGEGL